MINKKDLELRTNELWDKLKEKTDEMRTQYMILELAGVNDDPMLEWIATSKFADEVEDE